MGHGATPPDRLADSERALTEAAHRLRSEAVAALPGWVERSVAAVLARTATAAPPDLTAAAATLGQALAAEVDGRLEELLSADPDHQRATPLQVIRLAEPSVTALLSEAEVPPLRRDRVAEEQHPDDVYDIAIASLGDLSEAAHEAGIRWGVARATVHRLRHGA